MKAFTEEILILQLNKREAQVLEAILNSIINNELNDEETLLFDDINDSVYSYLHP